MVLFLVAFIIAYLFLRLLFYIIYFSYYKHNNRLKLSNFRYLKVVTHSKWNFNIIKITQYVLKYKFGIFTFNVGPNMGVECLYSNLDDAVREAKLLCSRNYRQYICPPNLEEISK